MTAVDLDGAAVDRWAARFEERRDGRDAEHELSDVLAERDHLTRAELQRAVRWKLSGQGGRAGYHAGKLDTVPEAVVEHATRAAFAADDPATALRLLASLPGVGDATASAVLAFRDPDRYCVADRFVFAAVFGEERSVSPTAYRRLLDELRERHPDRPLREVEKAYYARYTAGRGD